MSYQVIRDQNGAPDLILSGEPPYCHVLAANATGSEPDICAGQWLLMAFAVWSAPDVAAVQVALDLARSLGGKLNLGLRPYDDPDELREWCPGLTPEGSGPFWILLRDGAVCEYRTGIFAVDELREAMSL
jgi:hypothetical protein